jgi:hypothetical protein
MLRCIRTVPPKGDIRNHAAKDFKNDYTLFHQMFHVKHQENIKYWALPAEDLFVWLDIHKH